MSDNPNKWALPEFGLVTHAHHNTHKKLKLNPMLNPSVKQNAATPAGQSEGFERGYLDGLNKAALEMNVPKQKLEALLQQLHSENEQLHHEKSQAMYGFVKSLCERVLHTELSTSPDTIKNVIAQSLKMIDSTGNEIRIYCHQKLYECLQTSKFESYNRVIFEVNNQLPEYEFKIESDKQKICFSIEQLLSKLLDEINQCNSQK